MHTHMRGLRGSNIPKLELAVGVVLGVVSGVWIFDSALRQAASEQKGSLPSEQAPSQQTPKQQAPAQQAPKL